MYNAYKLLSSPASLKIKTDQHLTNKKFVKYFKML